MDYQTQKDRLSSSSDVCTWSADDCYPAMILSWLEQEVQLSSPASEATDLAFEGA